MRVVELFHSLQGEGILAGVPSVFIRLAGCPLRCRWCDTAYAWDYAAGQEHTLEGTVAKVQQWPCRHVVITGGEPLVGPDLKARSGLVELTRSLKDLGKHITIETAGLLFVPNLVCDLMSISPKLSNALPEAPDPRDSVIPSEAEESGLDREGCLIPGQTHSTSLRSAQGDKVEHANLLESASAIRSLISTYDYQIKFVVESEQDIEPIQEMLEALGNVDAGRILLMPQARSRDEMLQRSRVVAELCLRTGFRFSPRLQTMLWGNQRGK